MNQIQKSGTIYKLPGCGHYRMVLIKVNHDDNHNDNHNVFIGVRPERVGLKDKDLEIDQKVSVVFDEENDNVIEVLLEGE